MRDQHHDDHAGEQHEEKPGVRIVNPLVKTPNEEVRTTIRQRHDMVLSTKRVHEVRFSVDTSRLGYRGQAVLGRPTSEGAFEAYIQLETRSNGARRLQIGMLD